MYKMLNWIQKLLYVVERNYRSKEEKMSWLFSHTT